MFDSFDVLMFVSNHFDVLMHLILFLFGFCFLALVVRAIKKSMLEFFEAGALFIGLINFFFDAGEKAISIGWGAIKIGAKAVKLTWIHLLWPATDRMFSDAEALASCWEGRAVGSIYGIVGGSMILGVDDIAYHYWDLFQHWWFKLPFAFLASFAVSIFILVIGYMIRNVIRDLWD